MNNPFIQSDEATQIARYAQRGAKVRRLEREVADGGKLQDLLQRIDAALDEGGITANLRAEIRKVAQG